ncbi:MAG: hypothetical protein ACOC2U_01380 [bacterium]
MKQKSLLRSNKAHERLISKHKYGPKHTYHWTVLQHQKQKGRILSRKEKKHIWDRWSSRK